MLIHLGIPYVKSHTGIPYMISYRDSLQGCTVDIDIVIPEGIHIWIPYMDLLYGSI